MQSLKVLLTTCLLLNIFTIFAQVASQQDTVKTSSTGSSKVEIEASYPGDVAAWKKFMEKNLDASVTAKNEAPVGKYSAMAIFIAGASGTIGPASMAKNAQAEALTAENNQKPASLLTFEQIHALDCDADEYLDNVPREYEAAYWQWARARSAAIRAERQAQIDIKVLNTTPVEVRTLEYGE